MTTIRCPAGLIIMILSVLPMPSRAASWCDGFGPHGFSGTVYDAVVFEGDVVVTGAFKANGGQSAHQVARWDGSQWLPLGDPGFAGPFDEIASAAVYAGELYIGCHRPRGDAVLLKWNGSAWEIVDQPIGYFLEGQITSMIEYDGKLVLAGEFTGPIGQPFGGSVVSWDGSGWVVMGDPPDMQGFFVQRSAMVIYEGDLYLTGVFSEAGGVPAHSLARWDGSQWTPVAGWADGVWKEGLYTEVGSPWAGRGHALAVVDGKLIVGGDFEQAGNLAASNLVAWDGVTETWAQVGGGTDGPVYALESSGTSLFVGGAFLTAGAVAVSNVARWDGVGWTPLAAGTNGRVDMLFDDGTQLWIGGTFTFAGGERHGHAVSWNGAAFESRQNAGQGFEERVLGAVAYDGKLVVGGDFTVAGDASARRLAAWDGAHWEEVGGGVGHMVFELFADGTMLYVGGSFAEAGGIAAKYVARWDGSAWESLASGPLGEVYALVVHAGDLYVGGLGWLEKWNGATWVALPTPGGDVLALASFAGNLIVGGDNSGDGFLQAWDGIQLTSLGEVASGSVRSLTVWNDKLYIGGNFTWIGDGVAYGLGRWDGQTLESFGWDLFSTTPMSFVSTMDVVNDELVIGGVGGTEVYWLAQGGTGWQTVAEGFAGSNFAEGYVLDVAGYGGDVFAVGRIFETEGGVPTSGIARRCDATAVRPSAAIARLDWDVAPNPFNARVTIRFEVPRGGEDVAATFFDARGRRIRTLMLGSQDEGSHAITWDGRDDRGNLVGSGVYFIRLRVGSASDVRKVALVE